MDVEQFSRRMIELLPKCIRGFQGYESNYLSRGQISQPQFWAMEYLSRKNDCLMSELADFLHISRPAATGLIDRLIAQKLVVQSDGKGRIPCTEVLVATPYIRQLMSDGKTSEISTAMSRGQNEGMITFDQDLIRLCRSGKISTDTAVSESLRPENLMSMLQGISVKM